MKNRETGPCEVHAKIAEGLAIGEKLIVQFEQSTARITSKSDVRELSQKGYDQVRGVIKALACLDKPGMTMLEVFDLIHEETFRMEDVPVEIGAQQRSLVG